MISFATQMVTRLRAAMVDDGHGNMVPDWTMPDTLAIDGCSVQPGASQEDLVNRDASLIEYTVWMPAGVDVLATDRITIAGRDPFEIDGEPERWETGILDHVKVLLKRWVG
jgi:hypothetical protein